MALFVWIPESALSRPCDADVQNICLTKDRSMSDTPGDVLTCLDKTIADYATSGKGQKAVSPECKSLLDLVEPPDEKEEFDNAFNVRYQAQRHAFGKLWISWHY
jgi:hypothetical protein